VRVLRLAKCRRDLAHLWLATSQRARHHARDRAVAQGLAPASRPERFDPHFAGGGRVMLQPLSSRATRARSRFSRSCPALVATARARHTATSAHPLCFGWGASRSPVWERHANGPSLAPDVMIAWSASLHHASAAPSTEADSSTPGSVEPAGRRDGRTTGESRPAGGGRAPQADRDELVEQRIHLWTATLALDWSRHERDTAPVDQLFRLWARTRE